MRDLCQRSCNVKTESIIMFGGHVFVLVWEGLTTEPIENICTRMYGYICVYIQKIRLCVRQTATDKSPWL